MPMRCIEIETDYDNFRHVVYIPATTVFLSAITAYNENEIILGLHVSVWYMLEAMLAVDPYMMRCWYYWQWALLHFN